MHLSMTSAMTWHRCPVLIHQAEVKALTVCYSMSRQGLSSERDDWRSLEKALGKPVWSYSPVFARLFLTASVILECALV